MLKTKITNTYNRLRYGQDEEIIQELRNYFLHEDRVGYYQNRRFHFDSICCEATPGVLENVILILERLTKENQDSKLLNIGSGSSQFDKVLDCLDLDVYNTDIVIKNEDEHNKWCDLNLENPIPYDEKFDIAVAQEVIEHLENPWKLFRDMNSALNDGGYLIVTTPNVASLQSRIKFLFSGYFAWFTPKCQTYHINPVAFWEIELIASKTGFKVEKIVGSGDYFFSRHKNKSKRRVICDNEGIIYLFKKVSAI